VPPKRLKLRPGRTFRIGGIAFARAIASSPGATVERKNGVAVVTPGRTIVLPASALTEPAKKPSLPPPPATTDEGTTRPRESKARRVEARSRSSGGDESDEPPSSRLARPTFGLSQRGGIGVSTSPCVGLLRDALARVTRAAEALQDGELDFAAQTLEDLAADLWEQIERKDTV
jgi:hypothetical protein